MTSQGQVTPIWDVQMAVNWKLKVDDGQDVDITMAECVAVQTNIAYGYTLPWDALPESLRTKCRKDDERRDVPALSLEEQRVRLGLVVGKRPNPWETLAAESAFFKQYSQAGVSDLTEAFEDMGFEKTVDAFEGDSSNPYGF
ncbi:hypothetical protein BT63DRAFT_415628 [Microthyrium microscopicum]|uniref:Uncharacterized protein n=1 Tax=Microthyrium microscopicum TaxID=703497 RepID=A0A6A6U4I5_9PEZI|nr:hypothetical protein BT63DRAFT_415628 [Microthyrium microscopicum]